MLNPLYRVIARIIVAIHGALAHVLGSGGWSWALSIVGLTVGVRLVLVPLFVKQIKAQRTMQMLQPKIKEIKEKYKNDKQRQNEEIMKLQREHGNPLLGCLPILVQIPLFLALFHTLDSVVPQPVKGQPGKYIQHASIGLSAAAAHGMAYAKIFGTSLASAFTSNSALLKHLGSSPGTTKVVTVVLILIMSATTFLTQRQIFGRSGPLDPAQARQQKILLYLSPLFLGVFGFRFPVGVLLYWFTTNVWSMGQQYVVLRRMPPLGVPGKPGTGASKPPMVQKPALAGGTATSIVEPRPVLPGRAGSVLPADSVDRPPAPAAARRPGGQTGRPPKRRGKGQRRGGRR
ncbi:MAG: membrane protein insertase YidC [Mycobacteriales bacterium]